MVSSPARSSGINTRSVKDALFSAIFARTLIYTILFEDNEPDLEFLALGPADRVLSIAGAGCGVAAMLAYHPERIDAVDFNRHHLAITALKVEALRRLEGYEDLHALLAVGRHPRARELIAGLAERLPEGLANYWLRRWRMFARGFYRHGVNRRNSRLLQLLWPLDADFLKTLSRAGPPAVRAETMRSELRNCLLRPLPAALVRSPVALLGAGINYTQRERNLRAAGVDDVVLGVIEFASRLATTNLDTNWIAWHLTTGEFNRDEPTCLPLYLRPEFHRRAQGSTTEVRFHHGSLFDELSSAPAASWSHFCLSDVVDWLDAEQRRTLFTEVLRTARPAARVVCRSVEDVDVTQGTGLEGAFRLVEPFSSSASERERSRLYRRLNCYEVVK